MYWSQKPYNICDILMRAFQKGDIVFDPFMGWGHTNTSNNKKYLRKAVGVEINQVPIFIIEVLLKKYNFRNVKLLLLDF